MLHAMASWLESPDNEAILLAEYDEECLKVVATSCVEAAHALKKAAEEVDAIEPPEESLLTPESIEGLANIAAAFDASDDDGLRKQASVIDELLLTIAATPEVVSDKKAAQFNRLEELKKKYEDASKKLRESNKIADSERAIDKSKMTKQYDILEAPLSTRYCPDHPGAQIARIGEHIWQCDLDKKTYNYESGFTLNDGSKVPGGDVAQQTQGLDMPSHAIFDSRSERLGTNIP
jgi:hypothetical protein